MCFFWWEVLESYPDSRLPLQGRLNPQPSLDPFESHLTHQEDAENLQVLKQRTCRVRPDISGRASSDSACPLQNIAGHITLKDLYLQYNFAKG